MMLSSALFGVALTFACASAAAPGGGSWNILVGVDATDPKSKGPVPGHYDMISTEVKKGFHSSFPSSSIVFHQLLLPPILSSSTNAR